MLRSASATPTFTNENDKQKSRMNVVERLLVREEIDSLELDLARARERDDSEEVCALSARIARLEEAMTSARRGDDQSAGRERVVSLQRAA